MWTEVQSYIIRTILFISLPNYYDWDKIHENSDLTSFLLELRLNKHPRSYSVSFPLSTPLGRIDSWKIDDFCSPWALMGNANIEVCPKLMSWCVVDAMRLLPALGALLSIPLPLPLFPHFPLLFCIVVYARKNGRFICSVFEKLNMAMEKVIDYKQ